MYIAGLRPGHRGGIAASPNPLEPHKWNVIWKHETVIVINLRLSYKQIDVLLALHSWSGLMLTIYDKSI